MSDQTAPTYLEPIRDELDRLRTLLDDRSAALNRTAASNDTMRATLTRVQKLAASPPMIVSAIDRDITRTPNGRGGTIRFEPSTPRHGASGCPGDNVTAWFDDLRAALAVPTDQETAK